MISSVVERRVDRVVGFAPSSHPPPEPRPDPPENAVSYQEIHHAGHHHYLAMRIALERLAAGG
jgi:hypothetical protein